MTKTIIIIKTSIAAMIISVIEIFGAECWNYVNFSASRLFESFKHLGGSKAPVYVPGNKTSYSKHDEDNEKDHNW